jgi:hypothetical protein
MRRTSILCRIYSIIKTFETVYNVDNPKILTLNSKLALSTFALAILLSICMVSFIQSLLINLFMAEDKVYFFKTITMKINILRSRIIRIEVGGKHILVDPFISTNRWLAHQH